MVLFIYDDIDAIGPHSAINNIFFKNFFRLVA